MAIKLEARLIFRGDSALKQFQRIERQMREIDRIFTKVERTSDDLTRGMTRAGSATRSVSKALDKVDSSARKASRQVDRLNHRLKESQKKGKGLSGIFSGLGNISMGVFQTLGSLGIRGFGGFAGGPLSGILGLGTEFVRFIGGIVRKTIQTSIVAGTAALGGAAYLTTKGIGIAAENEQALISFETLLGSREAAEKLMEEMYEFAEVTPYDIQGVRDAAKLLLAMGAPADELLDRLRALGDAVSAVGGNTETMERVARALGQIETKGKISAEEMNQLAENGIAAWQILSDELGLTVAELMELGSQGKLLSKDILPVLYRGLENRFGGAMERQSRTLAGMFERIKEFFNYRLIGQWGEGIAQSVRPRLEWLSQWFDENEDKTARWGEIIKQTAAQAADWLLNELEKAFHYINERYINNPEFTELDFVGKVKFVFDDLMRAANEWLDNGGREILKKVSEDFGDILGFGLREITPTLIEMAANMGREFAIGFLDGVSGGLITTINKSMNNTGHFLKGTSKAIDNIMLGDEDSLRRRAIDSITPKSMKDKTPDDILPFLPKLRKDFFGMKSHAGGLSYVPYDGYIARLHKGERVLTAEENREYTKSGGTGGGVTVNVDTLVVREEADLQRIAIELSRLIDQAQENGSSVLVP